MCRDWLHLCGNYKASYCKPVQYVVLLWSHLKQALTAILPVTENEMPQTCPLRWWGCQHHWLWVLQKLYFKPAWHWLCCGQLTILQFGDRWLLSDLSTDKNSHAAVFQSGVNASQTNADVIRYAHFRVVICWR